jgi:uncharacterized protein (DUF433 family)
MEQHNLTVKDWVRYIGRPNRVYEVLNRKRPLTMGMAWKLHRGLGIPAESLINATMSFGKNQFLPGDRMVNWTERITADAAICHGKACIKGTRIMVAVILDNLADGMAPDEIVAQYAALTLDDVRAAISYAAALAREEELVPLR